jgi:isopentenyl-diphosphate delta-isomerase
MQEEQVVLVDELGNEIGLMGKTEAHQRVFCTKPSALSSSIRKAKCLSNSALSPNITGQESGAIPAAVIRAKAKASEDAASRRLREELGIVTPLKKEFSFIYKAKDDKSGLTEHEFDWVFTGTYDGSFEFNHHEINDIRWVTKEELLSEMKKDPEAYSFGSLSSYRICLCAALIKQYKCPTPQKY